MKKYLLDTDICIYFLKGLYDIDKKINSAGFENISISEITVAELKYGVENSSNKVKNRKVINQFIDSISILPIINCLDYYASEKVRLRKSGLPIDDFDLLIGCTAVSNNMTLVTRNIRHLNRIKNISIENWV
ncbi:MAG: type II toxin-antitoxin system VapC family toxin [Ignavibacteria bacterium]|nr:type II toxin-antitoxin system VapC family toxin [Ignavibacteria bacterium]